MAKKQSNKAIGNRYERMIAKELSLWMFNDEHILKRDTTSGAVKTIWTGDIIPHGQLPIIWNRQWIFHIETKYGYEQFKPNFWNYTKVYEWAVKSKLESLQYNQFIIYLICNFTGMKPLLFTNKLLDPLYFNICFPIFDNNDNLLDYIYSYNYKEILKYKFEELYNIEDLIGKTQC